MDLKDIKERAIKVEDGMEVIWPISTKVGKINLKKFFPTTKNGKIYSSRNRIIAFIDEEKTMYVIPMLTGVEETLKEEGYEKSYFHVPFSNDDYPVKEVEKWAELFDALESESELELEVI